MKLNFLSLIAIIGMSLVGCKEIGFDRDVVTLKGLCKSADGARVVSCDIDVYTGLTDEIYYSYGGWYPAPGAPNYRAYLSLNVKSNTLITADLKTPSCKTVGTVSVEEFIKLDHLIEEASKFLDESVGAIDMGDELVAVRSANSKEEYYLKRGDSSRGRPILKDAVPVRNQIDKIIAQLEAKNCSGVDKGVLTNLVYEDVNRPDRPYGTVALSEMQPPPARSARLQLLKVDLSGSKASLSGSVILSSQGRTCTHYLSGTGPSDLKRLAEAVFIEKNKNRCDSPTVGFIASSRVTLFYQNLKEPQVGHLGCQNENIAKNADVLVRRIQEWVLSGSTCLDLDRPYNK